VSLTTFEVTILAQHHLAVKAIDMACGTDRYGMMKVHPLQIALLVIFATKKFSCACVNASHASTVCY